MGARSLPFTIPINTAESNEIELQNDGIAALIIPTGWDAAAGIFFKGKVKSTDTEQVVYRNGVAIHIPAGAGLADTVQLFDPPISGLWSIILCSGTPAVDDAQSAEAVVNRRSVRVAV